MQLAGLESALREAALDEASRTKVLARLKALVASVSPQDDVVEGATADELFALLDEELESQG
jgi:pimaricinolide synthase PimS3